MPPKRRVHRLCVGSTKFYQWKKWVFPELSARIRFIHRDSKAGHILLFEKSVATKVASALKIGELNWMHQLDPPFPKWRTQMVDPIESTNFIRGWNRFSKNRMWSALESRWMNLMLPIILEKPNFLVENNLVARGTIGGLDVLVAQILRIHFPYKSHFRGFCSAL